MSLPVRAYSSPIVHDDIDLDAPDLVDPGDDGQFANDDARRMREIRVALAICRLLAEEELTLDDIAHRLEIGQRTARRYVYALTLSGLDIVVRRPQRSYGRAFYRLDRRSWHGLLYLPQD